MAETKKADAPAEPKGVKDGVDQANSQDAETTYEPHTLLNVPPPPNRLDPKVREAQREKEFDDTFSHLEGEELDDARKLVEAQWEAEDAQNERLNAGSYSN